MKCFIFSIRVIMIFGTIIFAVPAVLSAQMTWNCACSSAPWSRDGHTSVVFDNKMWLIGGAYITGSTYVDTNDVWYSTDGATWTCTCSSARWSAREGHTSVVFDNKMWVIGGAYWNGSGYVNFSDVWSSTDGDSWICVNDSAQWLSRSYHTSVVYDGKIWVIGGRNYTGEFFTDVWYSTNGDSWTLATDWTGWLGRQTPTSVVFNNKMWVLGGMYMSGNRWIFLNDIWNSTDGINWICETESAPWLPRGCHSSVVFNNDIWVMGGIISLPDLSLRINDVWRSTDGANWACADTADWLPRGWHSSVVYDNKIWVIGGDTTANFLTMSDVWYSTGLGIEEHLMPNAQRIMPNATIVHNVLNLQSSISNLQSEIFLLDITGRKVMDLRSGANDVRHLAPGVYFIRSKNNNQVTKIIVTR